MPTSSESKDFAVQVRGLGKLYYRGQRPPERSLYESLGKWTSRPMRWLRGRFPKPHAQSQASAQDPHALWQPFWALQDLSFELKRGEALAILGRNGSGKSTLCKILSRITQPTTGRAELRGRVGSLLEVGTGFHSELTGRDNVFLSGAFLGMKRAEIARKFDEIVAFSEIEAFIDTPVKFYSSGMYMRLAFAVSSHLDSEILILDEVLAVGDLGFQQKCLAKMAEVSRQGRTILYVSHVLPGIEGLCQRALWLDGGKLIDDGPAEQVMASYIKATLPDPGSPPA